MTQLETALMGSNLYAARFGESIASLGDIDKDGFEGTDKHTPNSIVIKWKGRADNCVPKS